MDFPRQIVLAIVIWREQAGKSPVAGLNPARHRHEQPTTISGNTL
jgi:hypothetical protein